MPELISSHSALLLAMGVSLSLAVLHLWQAGRDRNADLWVAFWAGLAVLFEMARWLEIHSTEREMVVEATRAQVVIAPLLICTLVAFVRRMTGHRMWDSVAGPFVAFNVAIALAAAFTPWIVTREVAEVADAFGRPYQTAITTPAIALIALQIPAALAWSGRDIVRATTLDGREKTLLLGSLLIYGVLGMTSIATAVGSNIVPGLAEYGPLAMAFGLSYLLVSQRRRLESELEGFLVERSRALLASEERFRSLFDQSPIGACVLRPDGSFESVNPRLVNMVGSPTAEALLDRNVIASENMTRTGISAAFRRCLEGGDVVTGDFSFTTHWGKTTDVRLIGTPIRDREEVVGVLGLLEDITERNTLETQLRQSQKLESVGQLAAGIAHEINNPMAYVRTNLGMLRTQWGELRKQLGGGSFADDSHWGDCEELLDESLEGVDRTVSIVRDMRELAHTGDEGRTITELDALVETCVRVSATHRKGTTCVEEAYGSPPPVFASRGQLQQVVVNLLVNALQAVRNPGLVRVSTAYDGEDAIVVVEDDGPGIPASHRDRLFDPFFTTKEAGQGTGLGLYVSYQIVSAHGGTLTVGESPEGGASFEMRLPALD